MFDLNKRLDARRYSFTIPPTISYPFTVRTVDTVSLCPRAKDTLGGAALLWYLIHPSGYQSFSDFLIRRTVRGGGVRARKISSVSKDRRFLRSSRRPSASISNQVKALFVLSLELSGRSAANI